MTSSIMWRRALAVGAIALAATATAGHARAAAEPATVTRAPAAAEQAMKRPVVLCPAGYLCLQRAAMPGWPVILVKEGERRDFEGGLKVSAVSNQTTLGYCVLSHPFNYGLGPHQEAVREHVVRAVFPSRICLT